MKNRKVNLIIECVSSGWVVTLWYLVSCDQEGSLLNLKIITGETLLDGLIQCASYLNKNQ